MKIFGFNFGEKENEDEHKYDVFVKCSECGVEEWQRERYCHDDNLCKKHYEEKYEEECRIEREIRELTYCKDREHNYIVVPGEEDSYRCIVCSKCGKYLN